MFYEIIFTEWRMVGEWWMLDVFYKICILNISDVMTGSKMIKFARFSLTR